MVTSYLAQQNAGDFEKVREYREEEQVWGGGAE